MPPVPHVLAVAPRPSRSRRAAVATIACIAMLLSSVVAAHRADAASTQTVAQLEASLANSMFALLNSERKANHLAPLGGSPTLVKSAMAHNLMMAKYNLMSHQCPGEASPGTRMKNAGYTWWNWCENIGWTSDETITGIDNMQKAMFNERPPADDHRLNILGNFKALGLSVYVDAKNHKIWYTQDFATPV